MKVANYALFNSWCEGQGIVATGLELKVRKAPGLPDVAYRYMEATQDFHSQEYADIIQAPLQACLRGSTLEEVADRLIFEQKKGTGSKWAPYIDLLPSLEDFQVLPMFWNEERLSASSRSDGRQLERTVTSMKQQFSNRADPWAVACAQSRCNFLPDQSYALTPMLDMLNHKATVSTRASVIKNKFDDDDQILTLRTKQIASQGDEVCISYGELPNRETLCRYGFIDIDNPCNTEELDIFMMNKPTLRVVVYSDGSIDAASKVSLRLDMATPDEMKVIGSNSLAALKPLSDRNELDVTSFLATYILEAVEQAEEGALETEADGLLSCYLSERRKVLRSALDRIEARFPGIEY